MRNYVVGQDKCLVRNDSPLVAGWEECHDLKTLMAAASGPLGACVKEGLSFVANKLPAELFKKIVATAGRFPHQETGFVLRYNIWKKEWQVHVPEKFNGGGASVNMTSEVTTDGFADIGTVHTHPGMSAHWSSVDIKDQHDHPGIHILLGLDNGKVAETLCSIFTRKNQYDIDLWSVCEKIDLRGEYEADEEWVKNLTYKPPVPPKTFEIGAGYAWLRSSLPPRRADHPPAYDTDLYDPCLWDDYYYPAWTGHGRDVYAPKSCLSQKDKEAKTLAEFEDAQDCLSDLEFTLKLDDEHEAEQVCSLLDELYEHMYKLVELASGKSPDDLIQEQAAK